MTDLIPAGSIEINSDLGLREDQMRGVDRHSLLNVFNVIEKLISELSESCNHDQRIAPYTDICVDVLLLLARDDFESHLESIEAQFLQLLQGIHELTQEFPDHAERLTTLASVIAVSSCRIREFHEDRFLWQPQPVQLFRDKLMEFLGAVAAFSDGRFSFRLPEDSDADNAYCIDFSTTSTSVLTAPPILHDTIRDLVANARKYSPPGSTISVKVNPLSANGILLSVADQGIGIPEREIPKVIEFGYRASNSIDFRTLGAGTGLTKAYLFCRQFNGRFFIQSTVGEGTTVTLTAYPPVI
jgi:signal transduction histidine kinase